MCVVLFLCILEITALYYHIVGVVGHLNEHGQQQQPLYLSRAQGDRDGDMDKNETSLYGGNLNDIQTTKESASALQGRDHQNVKWQHGSKIIKDEVSLHKVATYTI